MRFAFFNFFENGNHWFPDRGVVIFLRNKKAYSGKVGFSAVRVLIAIVGFLPFALYLHRCQAVDCISSTLPMMMLRTTCAFLNGLLFC